MAVPTITVIGNLGTDPQLRTGASGAQFVSLFIIASSSRLNRQTNQWEDGAQAAISAVAFGDIAQHISQSLAKGMRVIVQGRLQTGRPNPNQPDSRGQLQLIVDEIGPALSNATAQVTRVQSQRGFAGADRYTNNNAAAGYQGGANAAAQAPATDPFNASAPASAADADPWSSAGNSGDDFATFGGSSEFGSSDLDF